jgi:hypothetical protein
MVEIKYKTASGPEAIANKRMRDSGDTSTASHTIASGSGPRRLFHHVHPSGGQALHGGPNKGEPDIHGHMRTVVKTGDGT